MIQSILNGILSSFSDITPSATSTNNPLKIIVILIIAIFLLVNTYLI